MRTVLGIEYNGSQFNGWQSQNHGRSAQDTLEAAVSRVADDSIRVQCAGRTDSGVHAIKQVVHFETDTLRDPYSWLLGCNSNLPHDISVQWVRECSDDFHARFSALSRSYRYMILNQTARSSLLHKKVTWECRELDSSLMHEASQCLIGEHDFSSYRALSCQAKSPVRCIQHLQVKQTGNFILIDIRANAFLHHMVRNIAGVLIEIGLHRKPLSWSEEVLSYRDRTRGGMTAPADGLYLVDVEYPEQFDLPATDKSQWPLCL